MNTATKIDLADLQDAAEHLLKSLPKLTLTAKIDVAARLKGIAKAAKAIDDAVKLDIKAHLKGKAGQVPGEIFKAKLAVIQVTSFDSKTFKEEQPKMYDKYTFDDEQQRITFEVR